MKKAIVCIFLILFFLPPLQGASNPDNRVDSLRKVLFKTSKVSSQIEIYLALAKQYQGKSLDSAEYCVRQAMNLAGSLGKYEPLGDVYMARGNLLVIRNRLDVAQHEFNMALTFFRLSGNTRKQSNVYLLLGNIYTVCNNYPDALRMYMEGIWQAEKTNHKKVLSHCYNNVGSIYYETGNRAASMDYLSRAMKLFRETGDSLSMGTCLMNIGMMYKQMGNHELAIENLEHARRIFESREDRVDEAISVMDIGGVYSDQGDFIKALEFLQESESILGKTGRQYLGPEGYSVSELMIQTGIVDLYLGKLPEARSNLLKGYRMGITQKQSQLVMTASENLAKLYEKEKKLDSAVFFYKIFYRNSDSISRALAEKTSKLTEAQMNYEKKRKETDLTLQFERSKRKTVIVIYVISGAVLLAVIFILFLLLKIERQKKRQAEIEKASLDEKLEFQNKEMTTNVMYLNKMNEQVVQIAEKLRNLQIEEGTHNAKIIRSIINELQQGSGADSMKEFEIRFQNVHKDFYKNLLEKCPDLTPNELKLCAFLRLNMSTKDISSLTYQSENSLMVARTRLRQKLGIHRQENLISFLAQF